MQMKHADHLHQTDGLILQGGCGGAGFLCQRGILLRHRVHLDDRLIDLLDALGPFQTIRVAIDRLDIYICILFLS